MMREFSCRFLVGFLIVFAVPPADAQDTLPSARDLYNIGYLDEAVEVAEAEWRAFGSDDAALVAARARLDRFGRAEDPTDLLIARQMLEGIDAAELTPARALEWEVGTATWLFFAGRAGPAAVIFERLLEDPLLEGAERDRVFEWWATAIDWVGREQQPDERASTYGRMARRLETERDRDTASTAVAYWTVVAARGAGDPELAWHLALAAWARAPLVGHPGALRADLDRLVLQGVIPDLAMARTGEPAGRRITVRTMAALAADWEDFKGQ